jgi:hypothetical protein
MPLKHFLLFESCTKYCNFTFCRERVHTSKNENNENNDIEMSTGPNLQSPRSLLKSASISASKCIDVKRSKDQEVVNSILSSKQLIDEVMQ